MCDVLVGVAVGLEGFPSCLSAIISYNASPYLSIGNFKIFPFNVERCYEYVISATLRAYRVTVISPCSAPSTCPVLL